MSASMHTWMAAGSPAHPYPQETCDTVCATCATPIKQGITLAQIETPTTANHADYFRFGSQHVCPGCAWLFAAGKGRPGNYIATPGSMEYTVISLESVVTDKRPWIDVLAEIATLPGETPVAGVMTTDVKPRLWPRVLLATVDRFGLYLHAGDYDVSEWREFSLPACIDLIRVPVPAQQIDRLQAFAIGHAETIEELLSVVTHIGKKGSMGFGRVARWSVTPGTHTLADVLAQRPVPAAYYDGQQPPPGALALNRGWTAPYWYSPWWADCRVPE